MPIRFEANKGQMGEGVRFVGRKGASTVFLGDRGATLAVRQPTKSTPLAPKTHGKAAEHAIVNLTVAGGRTAVPEPSEEFVTKTHYLRGSDPSRWLTDVPSYAKVTYRSVLDGVDLVYHGENGTLEYDFVVAPQTNVDTIAMNVDGAAEMTVDEKGDLRIHTRTGDIVQARPVVYQRDEHGTKRIVESRYRLADEKVGFVVAAYDRTKPLVIDPAIGFATYLGGADTEEPTGIAADAAGATYLTGGTLSGDFPPGAEPGAYDTEANTRPCLLQDGVWEFDRCGSSDAFVAKIDPSGSAVQWMTYFGGDQSDAANAIALTVNNEVVVTGVTHSYSEGGEVAGFPVSETALNQDYWGGGDGFLSRISADGKTLVYSTLLRGSGRDEPRGVAVDTAGNAFVTGTTSSFDFLAPTMEQKQPAGETRPLGEMESTGTAFVVKVNPTGSAQLFLNMIPRGEGSIESNAIAIDGAGRSYITGRTYNPLPLAGPTLDDCSNAEITGGEAFVGRLAANGLSFEHLTCLRGNSTDIGLSIAVDGNNEVYVGGVTYSSNFDTTPGAYQAADPDGEGSDGFIVKLNSAGARVYSTYLGGDDDDEVSSIAVDSNQQVWATGLTYSEGFPVKNPIPGTGRSGEGSDAFITRLTADGSDLGFSTIYGGSYHDVGTSIAAFGTSVHAAGWTYSSGDEGGLPLFNPLQSANAGGGDCFVVKASEVPLLISPPSVVVAAGGNVQFSAVGGTGAGTYAFSIPQSNSGGTVTTDGAYTAGAVGGVTDIVRVTDLAGVTADATIQVGATTTQLVLSPSSTSSPPRGSRTFTASGGVPPYSFGFVSNASGGMLLQNGQYTAGSRGSVNDVIRVSDAAGTSLTATVRVTAALAITPTQPGTAPLGSISFAATGGAGAPFTWSVLTGGTTGSSIDGTGKYTAGGSANSVDVVQAADSLGNKATVQVSVGGGLAVSPDSPATTPLGTIAFTAFGGSGAFSWTLSSAPSGGTIDASSGVYTAGSIGNAIDVVRVTDSVGNSRSVEVTVGPALAILPNNATVLAGAQVGFSGTGGSGAGYVWSILTNTSGATIDDVGLSTAGPNGGTDTVRLTDSLGSTADATVLVQTAPGGPGGGGTIGIDGGAFNNINIGGGGNEDCTCHAVGGAPSSSSGPRLAAGLALVLGLVLRRRRRR